MERSHWERAAVECEADRATPYMLDRDNRLFVGSNLYSEIPARRGPSVQPGRLSEAGTDVAEWGPLSNR